MRFQSNKSSCGPAALHNALASLGIYRTEDELIKLCKQTTNGTSPKNLVAAIRTLGGQIGEPQTWKNAAEAGIGLFWHVVEGGRPVILCVDEIEHWVVCVGRLGKRFAVVDSADNRLVIYYTPEELCARWGYEGKFYGIVV